MGGGGGVSSTLGVGQMTAPRDTMELQSLYASVTALTMAVRVALLNHPDRARVLQDLRTALANYDTINLTAQIGDHSISTGRMALESLISSLEQPGDSGQG